jgi:hypothetical protein
MSTRFWLRTVENSIENPHFIFCSSFQNPLLGSINFRDFSMVSRPNRLLTPLKSASKIHLLFLLPKSSFGTQIGSDASKLWSNTTRTHAPLTQLMRCPLRTYDHHAIIILPWMHDVLGMSTDDASSCYHNELSTNARPFTQLMPQRWRSDDAVMTQWCDVF